MPAKPATLPQVFLRTRRFRTRRVTGINHFLLALLAVVLCTPVLAQEHHNRTIVETAYANFARGDVAAFLDILDPGVMWVAPEGYPYAGTYVGPDDLMEGLIARIGAEWDNYSVVTNTYVAEGDRVVALGYYSGTYKATGRSVEAPFAHVWQFVDGKVVSFRTYTDGPPWQRAVSPTPGD